jgi:hypothetical protein
MKKLAAAIYKLRGGPIYMANSDWFSRRFHGCGALHQFRGTQLRFVDQGGGFRNGSLTMRYKQASPANSGERIDEDGRG